MQYRLLSLAALVAYAYAQDDPAAQSSDAAQLYVSPHLKNHEGEYKQTLRQILLHRLSVVSVLQTALPSSLIQEALTNSAGVSSQLASEFAAGETPTWFTALPTEVQTYLVPAIANATAVTTTGTASATGTGGLIPSNSANGTALSFTSSTLTSTRRTTESESSQTGASATGSRASSTSSEAGAMPTIVAMGFAGLAAGMVGVLAL